MAKEIFAKGVSKTVPIIETVVSRGLTFTIYKPMSEKLKKYLAYGEVADVKYYKKLDEEDIIDVDVTEE